MPFGIQLRTASHWLWVSIVIKGWFGIGAKHNFEQNINFPQSNVGILFKRTYIRRQCLPVPYHDTTSIALGQSGVAHRGSVTSTDESSIFLSDGPSHWVTQLCPFTTCSFFSLSFSHSIYHQQWRRQAVRGGAPPNGLSWRTSLGQTVLSWLLTDVSSLLITLLRRESERGREMTKHYMMATVIVTKRMKYIKTLSLGLQSGLWHCIPVYVWSQTVINGPWPGVP